MTLQEKTLGTVNGFSMVTSSRRTWTSSIQRMLRLALWDPVDWMIIGAETGNRKGKVFPEKSWIEPLVEHCDKYNVPIFMKDSLVPIMGEKNMRRQFPWEVD